MSTEQYPNTLEIRRWAELKGLPVKYTGALPIGLIKAWNKTHPERPFVKSQGAHGTVGGVNDGCRCDRCQEFADGYNRDVYAARKEAKT